jgi:N-acetyl-gamma-glutamylphosphate reductase
MISVSIVNVTSYTGLELLRLLAQHPQFTLVSVTAHNTAGKRLDEVFPQSVTAGIITQDVIIDTKSGISGAGRSLTLRTHYAEANEDVSAYSFNGHWHLPEITEELEAAASISDYSVRQPLRITFIPHLIP